MLENSWIYHQMDILQKHHHFMMAKEISKVNVRIEEGLTDDGNNFISINTGDGTELDSEGKLKIKTENPNFHIKHINVLNVGSAGIRCYHRK